MRGMMRGRTRHNSKAAAPDRRDDQLAAIAAAIMGMGNAAAPTSQDPVAGFATSGGTAKKQGGTLTGLTPTLLGRYLQEHLDGTYANVAPVWERMERGDDACLVGKQKRLGKVCRQVAKWRVVTRDDSPRAARHAEFLDAFYRRLRAESAIMPAVHGGLRAAARNILDAVGKQFSFHAKVWEGRGPDIRLTLKHVPLWHFKFKQGVFRFVPAGGGDGQPIEESQWLVCAQSFGVMEAASVAGLFKRLPLHQVVHILQKWGVPSVYGKSSDEPGSAGWNALFAALQNIRAGFTGIVGGEGTIETAEPKGGGMAVGSLQIKIIAEMNQAITKCWLGSHLGTQAESGSGTLAGSAQAADTDDLIADDCDWLTELFAESVTPEAILYGLGDPEPLADLLIELPDDLDDNGDLERLEKGVKLGARIPVSYLHERFGWPVAEEGEDILAVGNPGFGVALARPSGSGGALAPRLSSPCAAVRHPAAAITRDLDQLYANSLQPVGSAYAQILQPVIDRIADSPNLAVALGIADGAAPDSAALGEIIAQTAFAAIMRGYVPMRPEIPAANAPGFIRRMAGRLVGSPNADVDFAPLPFEEAEKFWAAKRLIRKWSDIGAATYEQAVAYGFKVAGISATSALAEMKGDIERAISGESTLDEVVSGLRSKFGFSAVRAGTIVRTNVQTAFAWGHYRQLTSDPVREAFPIWAFDVVQDDDTSDVCDALAGQAYPADHPVWGSLYPPNHYNCRTTVVAITAPEAADQGFAVQTNTWPRDPVTGAEVMAGRGFEINVGRVANLADAVSAV